MAHTGSHKLHVFWMPVAVFIGLVGVCFGVVGVQERHERHMSVTHHWVGIAIVASSLLLQPIAIFNGWYDIHHKNGAFITMGGAMNCFLGLGLYGTASTIQLGYAVWMAFLLVFYIFDPLSLRKGRVIELKKAEKEGKDPNVDPLDALSQGLGIQRRNGVVHADLQVKCEKCVSGWKQEVSAETGETHFIAVHPLLKDCAHNPKNSSSGRCVMVNSSSATYGDTGLKKRHSSFGSGAAEGEGGLAT